MLIFYQLFDDNKKKLKAKLFKPFFFKYCWNNWTFKWGKKTIYWLHFLNLPPLKELQQIFVLYEAKVMIYWQKKWKKIQKVDPISSILNANKKYWSNSPLCQSILLSYLYISYLCEQTSMFLDFQMIILFVPSVASLSVAVNLKFCPCCPLLGCHAHYYPTTVVHKIPSHLDFRCHIWFCSHKLHLTSFKKLRARF